MADYKISELTAGTVTNDTLLESSIPDGNGGYDSRSVEAKDIADLKTIDGLPSASAQTPPVTISSTDSVAIDHNGTEYKATVGEVCNKIDITAFTSVTPASNDLLLISDTDDSGKPKSTTAAAVAESSTRFTTNIIDSNYIDLSSYSGSGNAYTFPKDGYLYIENNDQYQGRAMLNGLLRIGTFSTVSGKTCGTATFVRKGMTVYTIDDCYFIRFYPLSY